MDNKMGIDVIEDTGEKINRRRKIPVRTKLLFSSGAFQEATIVAAGLVTVLFYNQVLGVSPALCGTAFLIASVIDGITDPLVGAYSDRFRSRWGKRRHPLMLASALPVGIAFYFLYQPIEGLSEMGYFIWLSIFLVLMRIAITFYNIPHDALGAELTDDYTERTSVFGYNLVAVALTSTMMSLIVFFVIFPSTPEYANGLLNESRYFILASLGAVTVVVSILVCTIGTMDQIPYIHNVDISEKVDYGKFFKELGMLMRNSSYISTCLSLLTIYAALGILGVVSTYAYIYVYGLSTEQMTLAGVMKLPGMLAALPLLALMSRWIDKKQILMVTAAISGVFSALPHVLKMFDWFPGNESSFLLVALFLPLFLGALVTPVTSIIIDSQLVDVADVHEYQTGSRAEGIVFSVRSFAIKATSGVGGLLAGFGLEYIGFPENAEVGNLSTETINGLLFMNGPLYLMLYLLAISFMMFYKIDKKRHAEILSELETRREVAALIKRDEENPGKPASLLRDSGKASIGPAEGS
ncbi:MAG: MFS transporter [Gammaproteobacteria bacterium]|nr:MFS transporter [Gammaproteobacteria bacterium]